MDTKHDQRKLGSDEQLEKQTDNHLNNGMTEEDGGIADRVKVERKLVRKLDGRFSILIIVYILNYIDRNNASAARLKGFETDLKLEGNQYSTLLSILYVGYILMQIPSNMIVQHTGRPSLWLPFCMSIWGTISILTGITHNFVGALLTRFFLGFVEAAFFPGALFLLSKWYTKKELGLRTAILYCGSLISNAFGPLIAAGILSRFHWRYLFYIEGALTVGFALIAIPLLPDFPENSKLGFNDAERSLAQLRMKEDAHGMSDIAGADAMTTGQSLKAVFTDYKVYMMALSLTAMVISLSFNQFFPTLTRTLGYSNTVSLLLCAPPFGFATIMAFLVARHSDKVQERAFHIVVPLCFGLVGFIIAMSTEVLAARNTFPRPAMKRGIAIAFINAFSQLGNVAGAYIFPSAWGPTYRKSYAICIACFVFCIAGVLAHRWNLARLNRKLDAQDDAGEQNVAEGVELPRGFRYVI